MFINDTATTGSYTYCRTLSLHIALPFFAPRDRQQWKPFQLSACKFLSLYQVIFPKCKAPTHAHAPHYPCAAEVAATSPADPGPVPQLRGSNVAPRSQ